MSNHTTITSAQIDDLETSIHQIIPHSNYDWQIEILHDYGYNLIVRDWLARKSYSAYFDSLIQMVNYTSNIKSFELDIPPEVILES